MLRASLLFLLAALSAGAQRTSADPEWRRSLTSLSGRSPAEASARDVERIEENLRLAAPYFASLTPGDYEANRELVRRVTAYLAAVELQSHDPQMRALLGRSRRAVLALRLAIPIPVPAGGQEPEGTPPPPARPADAPFSLQSPPLEGVSGGDKELAEELSARYESDAANATAAWVSAETLRRNLEARGMGLNTQTATAVTRLQLYCEQATAGLAKHDWAAARVSLERIEYETEKVLQTVGR